MNIFFRVNSNKAVGAGHFARCSFLANYIDLKSNFQTLFVSKKNGFVEYSFIKVKNQSFIKADNVLEDAKETINLLSNYTSPKILIIDSYEHDEEWESLVRPHVDCLLAIDDLANRKHACDILVDCGPQRKAEDYRNLVLSSTQLLLGLNYCPISLEFQNAKHVKSGAKRIHLFFGSAAHSRLVIEYYSSLKRLLPDFSFNVALSGELPKTDLELWNSLCREQDNLFIGKSLVESLSGCSLAIGAPGLATWERAFLNIRGLYIANSENQIQILKDLEKMNFCNYIGSLENTVETNCAVIMETLERLKNVNLNGLDQLVDGKGLARILEAMREHART
jgi:UDP-2,4-diacetamido-2,4,6-trideoxy-beta-L-altropyranose hydrolase